jgi:hypothetical protein
VRRFPWWAIAAGAAVVALVAAAVTTIAHGNGITARPAAGQAPGTTASPGHTRSAVQPVITRKAAWQVLAEYTKVNNHANWSRDSALLSTIEAGSSYVMDTGAYRAQRVTDPANRDYVAFGPEKAVFYIPRQPARSWPHFFVARVAYADLASPQHVTGTGYLLFTQASPGARWKDVLEPDVFPATGQAPQIAVNARGYAQEVSLAGNADGLSAPPAQIKPDTIRWLDAAAAAGADPADAGNLADLRDVQFWRRQLPDGTVTDKHFTGPWRAFGLRTTDGGAIFFYALTAKLELLPPPGDSLRVEIPGYYTPGQTLQSATVSYVEQFAAADPPRHRGGPRVVADVSSIAERG